MNLHPHAWPVYDTVKLIGAKFTSAGVELSPCLPQDAYRFSSPLLGLEKSALGYSGWYAPSTAGHWKVSLFDRTLGDEQQLKVRVNGDEAQAERLPGGCSFWGDSSPGQPLRWEVIAVS